MTATATAMTAHMPALAALLTGRRACAGTARGGGTVSASPAGQVGSERGQARIGPRGERLACPRIQLGFGQTALHGRGLEYFDHLLAVGVRGTQVTAARGCWHLVWRFCHCRLLR